MKFIHIVRITEGNETDVYINVSDVRKITFDSLSNKPGIYVTYTSGLIDRFEVSSFDEIKTNLGEFLL